MRNNNFKLNLYLIVSCIICIITFLCLLYANEDISTIFYSRINEQRSLLPIKFSYILQSATFDEYFDSLPQDALNDTSKKPFVKVMIAEITTFSISNIANDYNKIVSGQFKLIEEMTLLVFLSESQMRVKLKDAEFYKETNDVISVILTDSMQKYTIKFINNKISSVSISVDEKVNYSIEVVYGSFDKYTVPKKIIITDVQADNNKIYLVLNNYTIL